MTNPSYDELEKTLVLKQQRINIALAIAQSVDDVPPMHIINAIISALTA